MDRNQRSNVVLGLILVLVGAWLLARQFFPELPLWEYLNFAWPFSAILFWLFLLLAAWLLGAPGLAVPATIVAGIGALLYWQNKTGNWESWAYAWTLIPGFVGLGLILSGFLAGELRTGLRRGGGLVVLSLILFAIFALLLGGPTWLGAYWPVLLILVGAWFILRAFLRSREGQR